MEARMSSKGLRAGLPLVVVAAAMLAGCGGVSPLTKERVARSETVVKQADQTIGNSEAGALELQQARDNLEAAQRALGDEKEKDAERYGQLAQLNAELAVAKSQSAAARQAADELLASIKTLRQEAGLTASDD
jgi:hypothetical protein